MNGSLVSFFIIKKAAKEEFRGSCCSRQSLHDIQKQTQIKCIT